MTHIILKNEKGEKKENSSIKTKRLILVILIISAVVIFLVSGLKILFNIEVTRLANDLFMLKYLPKLGKNASYGLLFIFGVLTSFHCVGMCGGIAISQTVKKDKAEANQNSWLLPSTLYNLGRVASYTFVGGIVGGLGQAISFTGLLRNVVPIIGGLFMIIMAVNLLGIAPAALRRLNISMPGFVARKIFKKNIQGISYSPLVVGLLSGLMPCGPLQMIQIYALGTRSFVYGAISLFIFSLGTVPFLFIFGAINTYINKNHSKLILRASATLVLVLGFVMIGRGLALSGINFDISYLLHIKQIAISENNAEVKDNIQIINTRITEYSYPSITVKKDVPVKWNLHADKDSLNDCNNAIVIAKLKIERKLKVGDNFIEFTPHETGTIRFTCWMGMIKSKIIVVDDLKKIKNDKGD